MAGLGIGSQEFALFRIRDPEERAHALAHRLLPPLVHVAEALVGGLSRMTGATLAPYPGRPARRKGVAPQEIAVAFCEGDRGCRRLPHLLLAVTRAQLHARVVVQAGAEAAGAMRLALRREASNLARKGKPFRKLRSYSAWNREELPEIAPAHTAAFWLELSDALAPDADAPGVDVGIAWQAEEARSVCLGDVLGAYRDLAPLYKLLIHAA